MHFVRARFEARLAMMFGGRIAEELIFGAQNVTTGAGNDIQQATNLARRMVTEWGMSDKLGRLRYTENEEQIFLGPGDRPDPECLRRNCTPHRCGGTADHRGSRGNGASCAD